MPSAKPSFPRPESHLAVGQVRAASAVLQLSQARLGVILDTAADAVVTLDADARITIANRAFASLVREHPDRLLGTPFHQWVPPEHRLAVATTMRHLDTLRLQGTPATAFKPITLQTAAIRRVVVEAACSSTAVDSQVVYVAVLRDVTERDRITAELQRTRDALAHANQQLHRLLSAQRHIEERERRRIARELHDDLQQRLVVIRMNQELLAANAINVVFEIALPPVEQTVLMVDEAMDSVRRIVHDLRPQALDLLGLPTALEMLMVEFARLTGIAADLEVVPSANGTTALPDTISTHLYRFVQEGLNNVRKHSQASFVFVHLDLSTAQKVLLSVKDDGQGFAADALANSLSTGLSGLSERAQALGGHLTINSCPGHGTELVLQAPLADHYAVQG